MPVYLIHLDRFLKHARHYVGWANDVQGRLAHHRNGSGSRFLQVCNEQGISYEIVRIWKDADKNFERQLKNTNNSSKYCPVCQGSKVREYHPKKKE